MNRVKQATAAVDCAVSLSGSAGGVSNTCKEGTPAHPHPNRIN